MDPDSEMFVNEDNASAQELKLLNEAVQDGEWTPTFRGQSISVKRGERNGKSGYIIRPK